MNIWTKSMLSAGAAAAALVSVSASAQTRDRRDYRDNDGISAGEVIAGAVILGGLVAIASSGNDRDGYYNGRRYNNRYGSSRQAVGQCVNAVEGWANRYSRSDVTQISDIDRTRNGYRITGKLVVQDGWRGHNRGYDDDYRRGDDRRGYGNDRDDRRGYGQGYNRGYDKGRFTCYVERGRVIDVDYRGLDQWR
ncbi:MAG: hypothetical protein ABI668_12375 [Sphingorhabdus sp.]